MTENEMTISQYDMAVFEDQKLERKRKHERAIARWQNGAMAVGWLSIAGTILGIVFALYQYNVGPSTDETLSHEEKTQCISEGGTWVKLIDDSNVDGYGTCMFGRE